MLQPVRGDALSVVLHDEPGPVSAAAQGHSDVPGGLTVEHGVFHEIGQHLLHQQRVHRYQQKLLRQMHLHRDIRSPPAGKLAHRPLDDLLGGLRRLVDLGLVTAYAGDAQQILHDADQPLGLLVGVADQLMALLRRQGILLLQQHISGPHDARQRRADVVGHRPQEVAVHPLQLRLPPHLIHLLGPAGNDTGHNGNGHGHQKGQRESRQSEADVPVGRGEDVVHAEHGEDGDDEAEEESLRQQRRQKHVQQEDHVHIPGVAVLAGPPQDQAQHHRQGIQAHGDDKVLAGVGKANGGDTLSAQPLLRPLDVRFLQIPATSRRSGFSDLIIPYFTLRFR